MWLTYCSKIKILLYVLCLCDNCYWLNQKYVGHNAISYIIKCMCINWIKCLKKKNLQIVRANSVRCRAYFWVIGSKVSEKKNFSHYNKSSQIIMWWESFVTDIREWTDEFEWYSGKKIDKMIKTKFLLYSLDWKLKPNS